MIYFIFGACMGSFLPVLAEEWAVQNISWLRRSRCDHCQRPLKYFQLVPILSQLFSNSQCLFCRQRFSYKYILLELSIALLSLLWANLFPFHINVSLISLYILTLMALIDYHQGWVPDFLQLCLLLLGLIFYPEQERFCYAGLIFVILSIIAYLRPGRIGFADIKLLSILCLYFPVQLYPYFLALASLIGLIMTFLYKNLRFTNRAIPFVPAIFFSYIITHIFRQYFHQ
ncbi:prepilin peptidase [Ignavigranum ruoffiae]|uniref:prepilin peptidase n=1 Tax=Ignavigranum ruoffiae TaxID=89093 RepID=UPI0020476183|nr:A24 family peptidase [Ignavigranum ruoffiae]UPQ86342.1 prepilin peptidase [Ignavigranum ruoffiae]